MSSENGLALSEVVASWSCVNRVVCAAKTAIGFEKTTTRDCCHRWNVDRWWAVRWWRRWWWRRP
jgi:hypothetical protein